MIFAPHTISRTGQSDAKLLVTDEKLFTREMLPFPKVYERNIVNDANPAQVIDGTSTVPEEFASSSESECLVIMICADDPFYERVLKKMMPRKCMFVLIKILRYRQTSETFSFNPQRKHEYDYFLGRLAEYWRNIDIRIEYMKIHQ
jgi:hypothetical protein